VFDSQAQLPIGSKLIETIEEGIVIVVSDAGAPGERVAALRDAGAEVLAIDAPPEERITASLAALGERGIASVLLEGGATLAGAFLDAGEIDQLRLFIAPLLLGGADSRPALGGRARSAIDAAQRAEKWSWDPSGEDLLIQARMREW
jgi:diaminohydroxyphosphoribosylaminopyrimidine deaminase/5-amino-6-(5-phosphoribosylamino)uracil reductase